jgi:hypothetical protein
MANEVNRLDRRRGKGPTVAATTATLALAGLLFVKAATFALWLILSLSVVFFFSYRFDLKRAQDRRRAQAQ